MQNAPHRQATCLAGLWWTAQARRRWATGGNSRIVPGDQTLVLRRVVVGGFIEELGSVR